MFFICTGNTELDAMLQVESHMMLIEGGIISLNPLTTLLFYVFLSCEHILLAHNQCFIHQVYLQGCSQSTHHPDCINIWIALTQEQDVALGSSELPKVHMGLLLKPVKVPLDGILPL